VRVIGAIADVAYAFADQVSPVSAYNTRWERWRGDGPERIEVIANGVDHAGFSPALPGAPRYGRPLVVNLEPILPQKGQLDLIEAAAIVRARVPDVEVRCCGPVENREYFDQCQARVRRHGLEGTVVFVGLPEDRCALYRLADVVAITSLSEIFPPSAIEAMLSGAAIVATDVGGVSDGLGQAGRLVGAHDPQAIAEAISSLLASAAARQRLGRAARARALEHFTEDRFVGRYLSVYESFAAAARRPGQGSHAALTRPGLVMRAGPSGADRAAWLRPVPS